MSDATRIYVALFRGLNVGGHGKLPMRDLVRILEAAGCRDVVTHIQSGNAVLRHEPVAPPDLATRIRTAVRAASGLDPDVLVLTRDELEAAAAANPFPGVETEPRTLHLTFLLTEPVAPDQAALAAVAAPTERFALRGTVFYLHAPDGIGRSRLVQRVEKALGVAGTSRNWRTVAKLRELAGAR